MKTALITGGSRGIGRATVKYFLSQGWKVITTSTLGKLDYSHQNLTSCQFELGIPDSENKLVNFFKSSALKFDCLVNNAWWSTGRRDENPINTELLRQGLSTNLIGTIDITQKLLPHLNNNAIIINVSSEYGSLTEDWGFVAPSYRIAKAGLNMFTRNFYKFADVISKKIKVYSFDPGWVKTDMGGSEAPRQPEEPAKEIFELANSNLPSGQFYRGLHQRDW